MKLPTPPGPHFSVDHLMHVCSTDQFPGPETQARAIHHFALLCPRCLTALDALPALDDCFPSNPIAMALAKMVAPPAEHRELLPSHRGAIAAARSRPLGFCHLLAEEAWWVVSCNLEQGVTDLLYGFLGPILANGACLDAPREAHDLQAHLLALIAHAYWWAGDPRRAAEPVTLARAHLVWGKGEAEPKATVLAVEAQLVAWQRKPEMGWALLDEAQRLLEGYEPADRQAEILLHQGILTTRYCDDTRWPQAAAAFRQGLAILDRLEPGTNPKLRLGLSHRLAAVEADLLFFNRLAGTDHEALDAAAVELMLAELEPLYEEYGGAEKATERAVIVGKVLVFTDLERAQTEFRHALGHYRRFRNQAAAAKLLGELLYLWANAIDCGISGLHVSFLADLWDLPQDEPFFSQVMDKVEIALAESPRGSLVDQMRQLRRAVRTRSHKAARAAEGGAQK